MYFSRNDDPLTTSKSHANYYANLVCVPNDQQ